MVRKTVCVGTACWLVHTLYAEKSGFVRKKGLTRMCRGRYAVFLTF